MDALEPIRTVHFASPVREVVLQVHFQSQHADRLRAHLTQIPPPAILLEVTPTSTALTVHPSHRHDEVTLAPIRIPLPTMPALAVEQRLEHWPVRVESVGGQLLFRASAADGRILVMQWPDPSKGLPASLSPIALSLETSLPDRLQALF